MYKQVLKDNYSKLINLYNLDSFSDTYGYGDREFWGWKIKDFSNGTMQGGVHSLAIGLELGIFKDKEYVLSIIDSAINAIPKIMDKNGSFVEAYPKESSFCVTSLVAFDLLSAIKVLGTIVSDKTITNYLNIIKPLINYICKNDEQHAIISNHLATGVAAIALWTDLTNENLTKRYFELINIILENQSNEGWYKEYDGADPGYQTLCTYYLFEAYNSNKDEVILKSLLKSLDFLEYFIHPDGAIGGLYGSRNTEVYYPAGIVGLSKYSEKAANIANKMLNGIKYNKNLLPQNIDIGNYIPLLNSYAVAAKYAKNICKDNLSKSLPYKK